MFDDSAAVANEGSTTDAAVAAASALELFASRGVEKNDSDGVADAASGCDEAAAGDRRGVARETAADRVGRSAIEARFGSALGLGRVGEKKPGDEARGGVAGALAWLASVAGDAIGAGEATLAATALSSSATAARAGAGLARLLERRRDLVAEDDIGRANAGGGGELCCIFSFDIVIQAREYEKEGSGMKRPRPAAAEARRSGRFRGAAFPANEHSDTRSRHSSVPMPIASHST
jgi:hypothetical protein